MEKRTPHYKLRIAHALIKSGQVGATYSAFRGADKLGIYDLQGMCEVVLALTARDFHKSMTAHANHRIWQDVYHGKTGTGLPVYIKLSVIGNLLIVSFKEL